MFRSVLSTAAALVLLLGCEGKKQAAQSPVPLATEPIPPERVATDAHVEPTIPEGLIATEKFWAPIPEGYTQASPERVTQLGQQFGQEVEALLTRETPSLKESIFIMRLPVQELDPSSLSQCRKSAKDMMRVTGATLTEKAAIVDYPFGETCQFALGGGKAHTIQTLAYLGKELWTVTCKTTTQRRKQGARECGELLSGFVSPGEAQP